MTASLMLRKLGSYPRQNGPGRCVARNRAHRTHTFHPVLAAKRRASRRVHAGLNKGEARNALARAAFLCRLGEIRDRSFEQQSYRASGLTLVTAAIVFWNTVYIDRAVAASTRKGEPAEPDLPRRQSSARACRLRTCIWKISINAVLKGEPGSSASGGCGRQGHGAQKNRRRDTKSCIRYTPLILRTKGNRTPNLECTRDETRSISAAEIRPRR